MSSLARRKTLLYTNGVLFLAFEHLTEMFSSELLVGTQHADNLRGGDDAIEALVVLFFRFGYLLTEFHIGFQSTAAVTIVRTFAAGVLYHTVGTSLHVERLVAKFKEKGEEGIGLALRKLGFALDKLALLTTHLLAVEMRFASVALTLGRLGSVALRFLGNESCIGSNACKKKCNEEIYSVHDFQEGIKRGSTNSLSQYIGNEEKNYKRCKDYSSAK